MTNPPTPAPNQPTPGAATVELPLVVEFLPGVAQAKGYLVPVGKADYARTIGALLDDSVREPAKNLELESRQNVLKIEYDRNARITVGQNAITRDTPLETLMGSAVVAQSKAGLDYRLLQVRISKPHEGGIRHYW